MPSVGIVLDPRLGLHPDDMVRAWNNDPEGRRLGVASVPPAEEATDFSPAIDAIQVVVDLAVAVSGSAVYDLIKAAVDRVRPGAKPVEVRPVRDHEEAVVAVTESELTGQ